MASGMAEASALEAALVTANLSAILGHPTLDVAAPALDALATAAAEYVAVLHERIDGLHDALEAVLGLVNDGSLTVRDTHPDTIDRVRAGLQAAQAGMQR